MAGFLVRRLLWAAATVILTAFFAYGMRRALGQNYGAPENSIDIPMLQGLAMWAAVLIVAVSLLADLAIVRIDPRIRAGGRLA